MTSWHGISQSERLTQSEWAERLADASVQMRAEAARTVPLEILEREDLYGVVGDPEGMVVQALLMNPSLREAEARELYRWVVTHLGQKGDHPARPREVLDGLQLRGFPCPPDEVWRMRQLVDSETEPRREVRAEALVVLLRIHSEAVTEELLLELWPYCLPRWQWVIQCVAHPKATPQLWERAAQEVAQERLAGDFCLLVSEAFAQRPRAMECPAVQDLLIAYGSTEARVALALRGPHSFFPEVVREMLAEVETGDQGPEELLGVLPRASTQQLRLLEADEWKRLLEIEDGEVRMGAIRVRGRLETEGRGTGAKEPEASPRTRRSGR